jgi:proteasome lid subunit RPN8/RPN11
MVIWLTTSQAEQVARHAFAEAPQEACGLIAGAGVQAQHIIPVANIAADPRRRYEMDHAELVRAIFEIQSSGLSLIGIYHSHPDSDPIPSPTDIQQANYPDTACVIVSLSGEKPRLAGWRISATQVSHPSAHWLNPPAEIAEEELTPAQRAAIVVGALLALVLVLIVSLSLLPPAPPVPGFIR